MSVPSTDLDLCQPLQVAAREHILLFCVQTRSASPRGALCSRQLAGWHVHRRHVPHIAVQRAVELRLGHPLDLSVSQGLGSRGIWGAGCQNSYAVCWLLLPLPLAGPLLALLLILGSSCLDLGSPEGAGGPVLCRGGLCPRVGQRRLARLRALLRC